jgi:hypothetical protein
VLGFPDEEVHQYRLKSMQEMSNAGFDEKEVRQYYGAQEPDMAPVKSHLKENLSKAASENKDKQPKKASTFLESIEAGWDMSVTGLLMGKPDMVLPEDAPRASRIASQISTLAGDLPAMIAGWAGGAALASPTGPAAPILGAAGAFAAPAGMRKLLMEQYEKGDIKDFGDFWERGSAALWEATKQGVVGAATGGAGAVAGKVLPAITSTLGTKVGVAASEIGTMVTVGKAIEGEMPNANDFVDAAIMIGGLHAVAKAPKLRNIYAKTGIKPEMLGEMAKQDPLMQQQIASDNVEIPPAILEDKEAMNNVNQYLQKFGIQVKDKVPEVVDRSDAEMKILEKIGDKEEPKKGYSFRDVYKDVVDKLDPIKEFEEQGIGKTESGALPVEDSPYKLARMVNDYKAKAKHIIEKGTIDYNTVEINGKGLVEIVEPHQKDIAGLKAFIVADRALEIEASGRKSGFDLEAAKKVVADGKSKYGETAKELVDFQNRNLKYLLDAGRVSQKEYDAMLAKGEKYIPFSRIIDETESPSGKGTVLKELKGSDLAIQDPFLSIIENTEKIMKLAETNRATSRLVDFAQEHAPDALVKSKEGEIKVWKNGKLERYTGDKNLVEAVKALDGNAPTQNLLLKIARGFTAVKKIGVTLTPDFIIRNAMRDYLTASVFSKEGRIPFSDMVVAMGDLFKKNDNYYEWLRSGGANGAFIELNSKYLENDVYKLDKETGLVSQTMNVLSKPIELATLAGHIIESAPRLAEFKRISKKGGILEGGYASREVTIDFQRIGAKTAALNSITAFQNVAIQGIDKTIRTIKEDPKGVAMKTGAYIVAPSVYLWFAQHDDPRYKEIPRWEKDLHWIILTDNWKKAENEDEYSGLPDHMVRQKNGSVEINKGTVYRIPKPQELGMIGSLVERVLDKFVGDNPNAGKDLAKTLGQMIVPSLIPDVAVPAFEHATGVNFFTERPLVPQYLEKELPAMQYTDYTTETSKAIGKILGSIPLVQEQYAASPMVIENYVRGWTGTLGMYALQLADAGLITSGLVSDPVKPAWSMADIPAVKAFIVRYPSAQSQSIQDFYDAFSKADSIMTSLKSQAKRGNMDEVEFIMDEYEHQMMDLRSYQTALSKQSQFIHSVNSQKEWSPAEKRQLIDTTYYQMIEISKAGLEMAKEVEAALKLE